MGSSLVNAQKLDSLRSFAGAHIPDKRLRTALIRSGGDVNDAAFGLLTDGTLGQADAPIQVTAAASQPANPEPTTHQDIQPRKEKNFLTEGQRRIAWRNFYYENYHRATQSVGVNKQEINKFITDLWKALGKEKREQYRKNVFGKLEQGGGPESERNGPQPADCSTLQVVDNAASAARPLQTPQAAQAADFKLQANRQPVENGSTRVQVAPANAEPAGEDRIEIDIRPNGDAIVPNGCGNSTGSHLQHSRSSDREPAPRLGSAHVQTAGGHGSAGFTSHSANGVSSPKCQFVDTDAPDGWPKVLCTRFCRGLINIPGKKKLLSAGDVVVLEVPPPPRAKMSVKGRGKRVVSARPAQIVRFSKRGREIGKLATDIAKALAPALQTGLVASTCKVIEAPLRPGMFAEVFLEATLSLTKEAFEGVADQEAVECGVKTENNSEDGEEGGGDGDAGVDKKRLNVINMISSLNICNPPERAQANFPEPPERAEGEAGAVSEEGAEAYYRTVNEINQDEVASFVPPVHLTCTLREYQRAGVGWMVAREKFGSRAIDKDPNAVDFMLNPLWKRKVFLDGGVFFVNPTTGGFSLEPPLDHVGEPYGGILADEMGLGKTVQCIACIVHDMEEQNKAKRHRKQRCPSRRKRPASPISLGKRVESSGSNDIFETEEERYEAEEDEIIPVYSSDGSKATNQHKTLEVQTSTVGKRIMQGLGEMGGTDDAQPETGEVVTVGEQLRKSLSAIGPLSDDTCGERNEELRQKDTPADRGPAKKKRKTRGKSQKEGSEDHDSSDFNTLHYTEESNDESNDESWKPSDGVPSTADTERASCGVGPDNNGTEQGLQEETEQGSDDDIFESPMQKRQKTFREKKKRTRQPVAEELIPAARSCAPGSGGTLVVCPMSLVTQWIDELNLHVESGFLRVTSHYGQSRGDAKSISLKYADVVVTTYGVVASEYTRESRDGTNDASEDGGALFQIYWRRVILDEAHTIRNRTTRVARAAFRLEAERRWCVTGTVIHNHVNDVFSPLHFLRLKPWSSWAVWHKGIVANIESKNVETKKMAMSLLRDIISSVTLRRKKTTRDMDGKCIVRLPQKTVELVRLVPSEEEQDFYRALHERSKVQFDTFVKQGKVMNNFATVLELLLRLRQACDHPYLVFAAPSKDSIVLKDKDKMFKQFLGSGSSSSQFVESVLREAESGQLQEARECPICLDAIDDPVAPKECGHPACRVCLDESIRRSGRCPVCRVPLNGDSIATLPRATRFAVDLKTRWRSSAKIDALLEDLQEVQQRRKKGPVGKTVVFSQFTSMLDLVGIALDRTNIKTLRIDGSVSQAKRASILQSFANDEELLPGTANVLLVSLKAGGVGLNLVSASLAVLLDIHWNPQVDAQAQDRVHRHGQTRDVVIKRYLIRESVEEKLLQIQDRKKDIADGALGTATDEDKKQARLSEFQLLFSAQ